MASLPAESNAYQQAQRQERDRKENAPRTPRDEGQTPAFTPSSSSDGFFQTPPLILNQLIDDIALQRALGLFLPDSVQAKVLPEFKAFGDTVLSKPVLDLVADAEKNLPYLKTWNTWGRRQDDLVTSEGWKKLSALGVQEGMVSEGYENKYLQFSRTYQFLKYLVWCGSAVWTTCPNQMTDGVAALLRKHLSETAFSEETRKAAQSAFDRVISRDPDFAWTTGQWMTERQGGSDVSQTETLATYAPELSDRDAAAAGSDGVPLGPWLINGFKWFSSATDSQMMVFLARTPNGISTFMAPMRRTLPKDELSAWPMQDVKTELNGVQIQRLKNKLGTKALPTAELVLKDVRAHLIGEEGRGVREMATVLNISRIHNGLTATGFWGRGLSIVRAFARVRKVGLKPLWTKSAFVRTLARMHVEYKANVLLGIFVTSLLGVQEQEEIAAYRAAVHSIQLLPPLPTSTATIPYPEDALHLFRLLAPVLKGVAGKTAIAGLQDCMECMGGVGYLENDDMQFNIARLFRDVNVIPIWEGTTDMMADDVRRVMFGKTRKEVMSAMDQWIANVLRNCIGAAQPYADEVKAMWQHWKTDINKFSPGEVELNARFMMERLADVVMGALLILDANRDSAHLAMDAVQAFFESRASISMLGSTKNWQDVVRRDMRLVFGVENPEPPKALL